VEAGNTAGLDVRRYLTVVRRHIILIVALMVILAILAYAYSNRKTPLYQSTAQLLYSPQLDISNPLNQNYVDPTTQELQMQSAVTIITGPQINKAVTAQTSSAGALPGYSVDAAVTTSDANASNPTDNGVAITVTSTNPTWAAKLANFYATAFVAYSVNYERTSLKSAETAVSAQLNTVPTSSQEYANLIQELHDLKTLSLTATGNFSVAVPAYPSSAPISPKPKRSAAIGAILGLFIGVGFGFMREKLDTRLHTRHEVGEIAEMPVIGSVGRIPTEALAKGPLVVVSEGDGRAAESIRVLRSNLQFASLGEENRVLMVMSAQKGEGKSLLTSNLAASLALAGKRVVLVDADLRRPRVHSIFGVRNTHGVSSVIAGFCTLDEAMQRYDLEGPRAIKVRGNGDGPQAIDGETPPPLTLVTSGPIPPNPGEMVASRRFAEIIRELAARDFDFVLIDSPAFLAVGDAAALAAAADGIVLLVNMKMITRPTLEEARDFLRHLPPNKLGVVTFMDQASKGDRYHYYSHNA
jgi:Mrp family chromosome partitioning ATPase/capsular polysaccharide biosynthesis protein